MQTHLTLGRDAIEQAERELGSEIPFLKFAKEIARGHQERWDGSGHPEGRSGEAIPVSARLMALADVCDALVSRRVDKPPFTHDKAVEIIVAGKGRHFDPAIADPFLELQDEFRAIAARFADTDEDIKKKEHVIATFTQE
jgi:putative two-component system response regulator